MFKKLTIPEFRAIFGLSKYTNINFEKSTSITDNEPLIFKNTFRTEKTTLEYRTIFGLLKNVFIDFWSPTFYIEMHPYMAM